MAEYELKGGAFSEGDTFAKIFDLLDQLQTQYNIAGHYIKAQGPAHELKGQGCLAIAEMLKLVRINTINLATGKIRRSAGFR